jgi:zinc transport system substrate-binding protein
MKNFRNIIFVLILLGFILQIVTMDRDTQENTNTNKIIISLSTFSLYDITKHIADESVELVMILPFGVDAHSFEPTPKLIAKIQKSSLVVYSGAGLEPWIDGFEFKHDVIDMSKYVKLKKIQSHNHENHMHKRDSHRGDDPHYWLDIDNMIISTNIIKESLIKIQPKNKKLYEKNAKIYINMLKSLDREYRDKISASKCKLNTIIVNHNAFSYLSQKYGFDVEALSGLSPESQPSAKNMIKLIEHIKEYKLSTIFFESFVSDKAIRSIANEAKVDVDTLQPIGNITADEANKHATYETIMKDNLKKISKALECK